MIYLQISDLLLTAPVSHTSTDWQVSTDLKFANISAQSIGDKTNLTSMLFNLPLDPAIQYYARARVLLTTGYTAWSNIDIFTPQDVISGSNSSPLPSLVSVPSMTITNAGNRAPIFNTNINISTVQTLGGATHLATSYVVEDMGGSPVWCSLHNIKEKNGIAIPPTIMNLNTAYRIRVMVHVDSFDTSQLITQTIITENRTAGLIMTRLDKLIPTKDLVIDVSAQPGVTSAVGTVYVIMNDRLHQVGVYNGSGVSSLLITIPSAVLNPNSKYIIRVTTNNPNIWDQQVFTTTF